MANYEGRVSSGSSDVRSRNMIFEPILDEGVFRFDCSVHDRDAAYPSISFLNSKGRETPITNTHKVPSYIPSFECLLEQQVVQLELPIGTSLYGTGEVGGQLERTGKRVFTWNTDAWGYGPETASLYQSHPWVLSVLPNGEALGILADTTRRCEIDLRKESIVRFIAPSSYPVITFGPFASPTEVLISLSKAIGTVFMPPKWSLGYQQCRWSYLSDQRVLEVAKTFREKSIPCDVIWMDIDYMDGFRCFTFHREQFKDPKSLVKDLHYSGFKAIWMLDPGIKQERGYFVYDSGSENDVWVQKADGTPFVGDVWPGPCVFPDYTQSNVRAWWGNLVKDFVSNGVDGIWNDMNEPAVSEVAMNTMPGSNVHRGDGELGGCQNHSFYHNVYGLLMARSTYEGMKLANENKRPFVLTRAGFIGSQRYAATWTGDNLSTWEHLHMSISMVLQLGLSGQPLSGPDIGGFAGNATPKLFGRWMGVGSLFPFCRGHSEAGSTDHEPWSFGEECEEVCRLALKRRYRLIPYIYTLFYFAHTRGTPVATPTFFADPKDHSLRKLENSFLLGPVLVYASTTRNQGLDKLEVTLPKGIWLGFDFSDAHPDLPALYLKGGSIIPVGLPLQHVGEASPSDELTLLVALDEYGKAEGFLFEDDGDGYEFTKGNYLLTHYVAELQSSVVTVSVHKTEGSWKRPTRCLHIQLLIGGGAMLDTWGALEHLMHEYDRLYRPSSKPVRMRLFIFITPNSGSISISQPDLLKPQSNADFLFGLDNKTLAPPVQPPSYAAVKYHEPVPDLVAQQPEYPPRGLADDSVEIQRQLQRLQVSESEQSLYRRSVDGFTGGYPAAATSGADFYTHKMLEKAAPSNSPTAVHQPAGYWPEKQFSSDGFPMTGMNTSGGGDQHVYMMPTPGTFYHAPQVMRPPAAQVTQGYYAVQRMSSDGYREQPVYGGVQHQNVAFSSAGQGNLAPAQQVKPSGYAEGYGLVRPAGVADNAGAAGYAQVAYDSASGRHIYYTAPGGMVHAPQYQGVAPVFSNDMRPAGAPVGQDTKGVNKGQQG